MTIRKTATRRQLHHRSHGLAELVQRPGDEGIRASKGSGAVRRLPRAGTRAASEMGSSHEAGNAANGASSTIGFSSGISSGFPSGIALGDYIELPFLHWRLIAACLATSIVAAVLVLILAPRAYESEAKLMVTVGRESVGLDPTATTSPTLMLQKTQEEEINSALEVLSSRQVAELVVDKLTIDPILNGYLPSTGDPQTSSGLVAQGKAAINSVRNLLDSSLLTIGVKDAISPREQAVRKVIQSVNIYAPKRSTAITIHAEAKSPEMAQALAAAVTYGFLDRHQSVNFNEGSRKFFHEQSQAVETKMNQLLAERSEFMRSSKVVSTEDQRRMLTDQMGSAERDILVTRGELKQATAEIEDLIGKAGETVFEIVAKKDEQTDATWSGMRQRVYELEIQEQSFASMYSEDNPKLINARQQLEGARQILEDLDQDHTNRSLTPNPVRIRIEEDLQRLQTKTVGLKSMLEEKEQQRRELNAQIDELLAFELKLNEMNRNISLLENSLGSLKLKLEEARVIDELQADHISNISIYQPASLVERPISPQKPLIALTFPALGLMVGLGLAFIREFGNSSLRTVSHVQNLIGSPVLSTIPLQRKPAALRDGIESGGDLLPHNQCHQILSEVVLATSGVTDLRGKTVGVIGVEAGCGASTLAAALALASSRELGLKTLLIDADAKQATVSVAFGLSPSKERSRPHPQHQNIDDDRIHEDEIIELESTKTFRRDPSEWRAEGLRVLGPDSESHRRLIEADPASFATRLNELCADYDLIIVDLPPASRPDRTSSLARKLDYLLVVIESEKTDQTQAARLIQRLASQKDGVGIVLNKTRRRLPRFLAGLVG